MMRMKTGVAVATTMLCLTSVVSAQLLPSSILADGDILVPSGTECDNVGQPCINATGLIAVEGDDIATTLDDFLWVAGIEVLRSGDLLIGTIGTLDNIDRSTPPAPSTPAATWRGTGTSTARPSMTMRSSRSMTP